MVDSGLYAIEKPRPFGRGHNYALTRVRIALHHRIDGATASHVVHRVQNVGQFLDLFVGQQSVSRFDAGQLLVTHTRFTFIGQTGRTYSENTSEFFKA